MGRHVGALICTGLLAVALFAAGNVASCYAPPTPACGFACGPSNSFNCPADYTCATDEGFCKLNSAPAGTSCLHPGDAGGPDAGTAPPRVIATTPADGATGVSRAAAITATFDLPIGGVDNTDFVITDGAVQAPGTYSYDAATQTATFTPDPPLHGGHLITVQLTTDIRGTSALMPPIVAKQLSYTTLDDEPPQLVSSNPLDQTTNVPIGSPIVVVFSEPVVGVAAGSFLVAAGATGITGTITATPDQLTWTFTPTIALPPASTITVTLTAAITDQAAPANPLAPTTFTFQTQ